MNRAPSTMSGRALSAGADRASGLELTRRPLPRAILLAVTMPVTDGFALRPGLRARPGRADVPTIVFSARDISAADREQIRDADGLMSKTASLKELAGELRALAPPEHEPAAP